MKGNIGLEINVIYCINVGIKRFYNLFIFLIVVLFVFIGIFFCIIDWF